MSTSTTVYRIGKIEKITSDFAEIKWIIDDYFSVIHGLRFHWSPNFFFENASWCFSMVPNWNGYTILTLTNSTKREYSVQYNFILKAGDGAVVAELTEEEIMNGNHCCSASHFLIKSSELKLRKAELVPSNRLTITCTLKRILVHSNQSQSLDKNIPLQLTRLDKLSKDFKDLFDSKETCDTSLFVKDKEYRVHLSVLIARSTVFAANFKHDTLEKQTGVITIEDCDPVSFQKFLEYLYCGKIEKISVDDALNLYYTSDKYDLGEIKAYCVEYLLHNLTAENLSDVAILADKYEENELFSSVQKFFNTNMCQVFETSGWDNLFIKDHRLVKKLLKQMSKEISIKK